MGSPLPVSAARVPVSCVPPASRWPTPSAPLAGAPPVSGPPPGSFRPHVRTPAGSARIVPLWLSCSPKPSFLLGLEARNKVHGLWFTGGARSEHRKGPIQSSELMYIASLEKAVALVPANEHYALPLGLLYAGAILTVNPQSMYRDPSGADPEFARRASQILDTTQNPYILEPAVKLLKSEYTRSLMMGRESASIGALAQQYFQRAKTLDPDLDQLWIYQQIDPKMIGMFAPGAPPPDEGRVDFETAAKQIRRLPADA